MADDRIREEMGSDEMVAAFRKQSLERSESAADAAVRYFVHLRETGVPTWRHEPIGEAIAGIVEHLEYVRAGLERLDRE